VARRSMFRSNTCAAASPRENPPPGCESHSHARTALRAPYYLAIIAGLIAIYGRVDFFDTNRRAGIRVLGVHLPEKSTAGAISHPGTTRAPHEGRVAHPLQGDFARALDAVAHGSTQAGRNPPPVFFSRSTAQ